MLPVANPNHSILETDNGNLSRVCKPSVEQSWVRAHLDDVYLWYQNQRASILLTDPCSKLFSVPLGYKPR